MPSLPLSVESARSRVLDTVHVLDAEPVPVADALDRVLADDVRSAGDVPPLANSAMDGYAVTAGPAGRTLPIVGESRAGAPALVRGGPDAALRISTGAAMPAGADAVVPLERAEERDGRVRVDVAAAPGANVRGEGEDMRAGELALRAGTPLSPAALGVVVGAGAAEVACARRPRVAVLCTGDELRAPGERLGPGEIHNSNLVTVAALSVRSGAEVLAARRVRDDREATEVALRDALDTVDVLIVSGGVSVGPHDHVKPALGALGVEEVFWRVALRPGRPTWFGQRDKRLVFGLPGNPVSAMVTFLLFARPALRALQGASPDATREPAVLGAELPRNPERDEAVRVRLDRGEGTPRAVPTGPQGSHVLTSMLLADGLALVPAGTEPLPAGSAVTVERI